MTLPPASTRGPVEPIAADYKRAAATLLHTVGPFADGKGLNAVLTEANEADEGDGRAMQLLVAVQRLIKGLCPDLVSPENIATLQRVALHAAEMELHGLTGLAELDDPEVAR